MPRVLSKASLSQGLTQSKTLDCGGRWHKCQFARAPINLTSVRQSCFTSRAKALRALNSRRRSVPSKVISTRLWLSAAEIALFMLNFLSGISRKVHKTSLKYVSCTYCFRVSATSYCVATPVLVISLSAWLRHVRMCGCGRAQCKFRVWLYPSLMCAFHLICAIFLQHLF